MSEYYMPRHKWQLVDMIYTMCKGVYSKAVIGRKSKQQLYGWRKSLILKHKGV